MKWPVTTHQLAAKFKPKRFTTIVMMLVIWAGVVGSLFAGITTDLRNREYLKGQAVTIADALPLKEVASLKGNSSDSNKDAYRDLKQRLQKVRHDQPDLEFVYLMGERNGQAFFFVDSEAASTPNYSPPGETYDEASVKLLGSFKGASQPFVEGPDRDRYGTWISALAPIQDPNDGHVIAMVGIDVDARAYYERIALYAVIPLLLASIPFAGLLRDLKLANKEHEIAELKNQFVSIASHELRSPLTGMLWAEQSLMRDEANMTDKQQEMLMDMYRSTEASLVTVNEILDLSIFERGEASKLQHEQVDLLPVVDQVIGTLKLGAGEKKLTVKRVGEWPKIAMTNGDVGTLKRALMNVISNAIKYSKDGGEVAVGYRAGTGEHILSIKDNGIGIPAEEQAKVLNGYYRATNATQQQAHGTGLGLWLAKMVAEQHGGRLWLHSKVNHGTTIYIALPVDAGLTSSRARA